MKGARLQGVFVGPRDCFEAMNRAFVQHRLKPAIGSTYPFAEALDGLRAMEAGTHFGKIVVKM